MSASLTTSSPAERAQAKADGRAARIADVTLEANPYLKKDGELAQAWQDGYLAEHETAARYPLPDWINADKWFSVGPNTRWSGSQAILLLLGHGGQAGAMAALRGMPSEPPSFVEPSAWKRAANSRYSEAITLERHASLDVALETQAMYARTEANKNCKHVWSEHASKFGRACGLCGFVEDLR